LLWFLRVVGIRLRLARWVIGIEDEAAEEIPEGVPIVAQIGIVAGGEGDGDGERRGLHEAPPRSLQMWRTP
jgi:hypothetical protein